MLKGDKAAESWSYNGKMTKIKFFEPDCMSGRQLITSDNDVGMFSKGVFEANVWKRGR